ncbi:MAG: hypothetical protein J0L84_20420 [Verrucomicrobia bacterium]|nr:hypothetical protein [Verrucomicrobiota bacterium]
MKPFLLPSLVAAVVLVSGCQTTDHKAAPAAGSPAATAPVAGFDTSALVAAFKNADLGSNQLVQSVVSALSGRDFSGALSSLQKLARIPGLTAPQASAVQQLIGSVSAKAK